MNHDEQREAMMDWMRELYRLADDLRNGVITSRSAWQAADLLADRIQMHIPRFEAMPRLNNELKEEL